MTQVKPQNHLLAIRILLHHATTVMRLAVMMMLSVGMTACGRKSSHDIKPQTNYNIPIIITPILPATVASLEPMTIKTLCLKIDKYETVPTVGSRVDPLKYIGQIMGFAGVTVVQEGVPCNATLSVTLSSQPGTARYGGDLTSWEHYTTATAKGTLGLSMGARKPQLLPVEYQTIPPRYVGENSYTKPEDAPLDQATRRAIMDGLVRIWGADLLVRFVEYGEVHNIFFRGIMAAEHREAFESLKPEQKIKVLPKLIQLLADQDADVFYLRQYLYAVGKSAVPDLVTVLQGRDAYATGNALDVLEGMKGDASDAVPALLVILRSSDQTNRKAAADALREICGDRERFKWTDEDPPPRDADADNWQRWLERHK